MRALGMRDPEQESGSWFNVLFKRAELEKVDDTLGKNMRSRIF
jgi:hypothetical protein